MCQILNLPDIRPAGYPADLKTGYRISYLVFWKEKNVKSPVAKCFRCCQLLKVIGTGPGYENYLEMSSGLRCSSLTYLA